MENRAFKVGESLHGINGKFTKMDDTNSFAMEMPQFNNQDTTSTENTPITFSWKDLTIKVKGTEARNGFLGIGKQNATQEKLILDKVNGYCKPGELMAIMGASGAGKSTLLNALTFRNLGGLSIVGNRYANGEPVTPNSLTSVSAYVQQDDLFIGTLTVQEHLNFQAAVRMDKNITQEKRRERIEQVKEELGLKKCENTLIGVPGRVKGISGGEKRRLAFASEILTNPPLMFCDEPTSGLDSYMAQNVIEMLRKMAQRGKTVVATIHQPNSQVFALFDRLLLMAEGRVAFFGRTDEAVTFFENQAQLPCPLNFNPADHYVHVMAVSPGKETESRQRVKKVCDTFEASTYGKKVHQELGRQLEVGGQKTNKSLGLVDEKQSSSPYKASWWSQFKALLWRSFLSVIKEPIIMQVRIVQTIFLALLLGVLFFGQDDNHEYEQAGVMNINGALFQIIITLTLFNMFPVVNVFSRELPIFLREHFNGMYRTEIYYLCKQIADLPMFLITPVLFVTLYYFMVGMNLAADRFFWCILIAILITQVVVGFGYMISCGAPNPQVAITLAPTFIIPFMIIGGFFMNAASIPDWLLWLKYTSWYMYGNELLNINQWKNVNITDCNPTEIPSDDYNDDFLPCYPNGDAILTQFGFNSDDWSFDMGMLVILAVAFRLVGYFLLLKKTYRKS